MTSSYRNHSAHCHCEASFAEAISFLAAAIDGDCFAAPLRGYARNDAIRFFVMDPKEEL
jgi:hypothetical protein